MLDKSSLVTIKLLLLLFVSVNLVFMGSADAVFLDEESLVKNHDIMYFSTDDDVQDQEENGAENLTFKAVPRDGEVELYWWLSDNKSERMSVAYYNITKDGKFLTQIEDTSYIDKDVENGVEYTYQVKAVGELEHGGYRENITLLSEEVTATPESYWWIWIALPINASALVFVIYYVGKNKEDFFFGKD